VGQAVSENAEKWQNTIDESKLLALAPQKSSEHRTWKPNHDALQCATKI